MRAFKRNYTYQKPPPINEIAVLIIAAIIVLIIALN